MIAPANPFNLMMASILSSGILLSNNNSLVQSFSVQSIVSFPRIDKFLRSPPHVLHASPASSSDSNVDDKNPDDDDDTDNSSFNAATPKDKLQLNGITPRTSESSDPASESISLSSTSAETSSDTITTTQTTTPTTHVSSIRQSLPDLISMTRPSNLPAVVLLHMLGTYLALQSTPLSSSSQLWRVLAKPGSMVTLVALLLTTSTSMLVNDYFDYKLGNDSLKPLKPLPAHRVDLITAKNFVSILYGIALVCVTLIPGAPARLAMLMGLILTFYYTQHLKPRTWLKNTVCATLTSLAPLTSGISALALMNQTWTNPVSLWRVTAMLFVGILGREMTMDLNDVEDDSAHGVRTVPVKYGRKYASKVTFGCSMIMSVFALSGPIWQVVVEQVRTAGAVRRLSLASLGCGLMLRRAYQVFRTKGEDYEVVATAVDEGLLTVVLLMASFV